MPWFAEEEQLTLLDNGKKFLSVHWKGLVIVIAPIIAILICVPNFEPFKMCGAVLIVMAAFWVTECIPLPVTSFLPILVFPLVNITNSTVTCSAYANDTIVLFYASIVMAYAIEQSGLHIRMALACIKLVGYSHYKLLFAIGLITMFVSMWITNTAATTMMVPIVFAVLRVFENQGLLSIYETNSNGDTIASDITTCYFCMVTFSATNGGIGTLVGTATNLSFKGLFISQYPKAPELISFPKFSAFTIPPMILIQGCIYLCMIFQYLGWLRPKSDLAEKAKVPPSAIAACKKAVESDFKKLGRITFWEISAALLFVVSMLLFFCRSPQIFSGWGDYIAKIYKKKGKNVPKDSVVGSMMGFIMLLWAGNLKFINNFRAKLVKQMPITKTRSVIDWEVMNRVTPYSFMFLLGGGFALSKAATPEYTDLNGEIGQVLKKLESLPKPVVVLILVIFTTILTNFASNVAVSTVICPIATTLAEQIKTNPLMFSLATGLSASYCLFLPVGTPGNLIIQGAAAIPTGKMIKAGVPPTVAAILILFLATTYYSPLIWSDINEFPSWAKKT